MRFHWPQNNDAAKGEKKIAVLSCWTSAGSFISRQEIIWDSNTKNTNITQLKQKPH